MKRFVGRVVTARVALAGSALTLIGATLIAAQSPQPGRQVAAQGTAPAAPQTRAVPAGQAARPTPVAAPAAGQAADGLPQTIVFNRDIRPILSDKCFKCHGPGTQLATVRFDLEDGAKHELKGGRFAIVPGDPAKSEVIRRITATNAAVRMPKSGIGGVSPGEPLTSREIALLRRWIEQGAKWEKHWSFNPPTRPAVPTVSDPKWVRNPIDAFVLRRLDREGLRPSPAAEKGVLLRRVTLDLTGLPPTMLELEAFLNDTSPNAYEKVVDRLLASPRYGERMAFPWLEAARYADSTGYFHDGPRFMWRWRDWVVNAFNRNMPYDEFIRDQLAGDLLPNATLEQKIATGFNRNHRGNSEVGIIDEEFLVESVVDRVDTTATVFMGLSVGCSRCHDHKYDPITAKDYYSMFAYFNNLDERGHARRAGNSPPFMTAPTPEQVPVLKERDAEVEATRDAFAKLQPEIATAQQEWEAKLDRAKPIAGGMARGLVAHYPLDGNLSFQISVSRDGNPTTLKVQDGDASFASGRIGQAAAFDGKRVIVGGDLTGFTSHVDDSRTVSWDDPYTLAAWIYPTAPSGLIITKSRSDSVVDDSGVQLKLVDGRVGFTLRFDLEESLLVESEKTVSLNQWHQVTLAYNGNRWASGVTLYVDGEPWALKALKDDFSTTLRLGDPIRIGGSDIAKDRFQGSIDDVRIYNRALSAEEAMVMSDATPITEIAALPEAQRTKAQAAKIREYFLTEAAPAPIRTAFTRMLDAQRRRNDYYESLPTVMVMEEMPTPRQSHVLVRGMYDRPGEPVEPAVPAILAPANAADYPKNRLGLARWLVSPDNPLTARVTVNRYWQQYFGAGIVKSIENFGTQGEAPSNQDLLDWLATEFVRTGWDVKALQKTMVMSATYQQRSSASRAMWDRDPDNRLLARGPNNRLTAEMVRDQALSLAGLLVNKIGGPSVKPYQPPGLWAEVGEGDADDRSNRYIQDHGDNLYRRSMYTFWKRSVPPPGMANFDAAIREAHEVRIVSTNTPLQALDLMNDVTYVDAARVFAERVMREGGKTPRDRVTWAFRAATARQPDLLERGVLLDAFENALTNFTKKPEDAVKYVSHGEHPRDPYLNVPELAAYTTVTSLILNLNQTITKE